VRRRTLVVGAALAGAVLAPPAQASASVGATYDCQRVIHHTLLVNTPVNGYPCTGPAGPGGAGSVLDTSTGHWYWCGSLSAEPVDGALFVFGDLCTKD
jgi:hypothetical protein